MHKVTNIKTQKIRTKIIHKIRTKNPGAKKILETERGGGEGGGGSPQKFPRKTETI